MIMYIFRYVIPGRYQLLGTLRYRLRQKLCNKILEEKKLMKNFVDYDFQILGNLIWHLKKLVSLPRIITLSTTSNKTVLSKYPRC